MSFTLSGVITGAPQTNFTSPTYTLTASTGPDVNTKRAIVSAVGGTQTGVDVHSVARPFDITVFKPKSYQILGKPHPITGLVSNIGMNKYLVKVRKGALPLAGQPSVNIEVDLSMKVPAGVDLADPAQFRAACSLIMGLLWAQAAGAGDTGITGES